MRVFFVFFVAAALLLGCATGEPPAKRAFVYPLPENLTGEWLYQNLSAHDANNQWAAEREMVRGLSARLQGQEAPAASADVFVVPAYMTLGFMRMRTTTHGRAQLRAWNNDVIAFMRSFGPWGDSGSSWPELWSSNATLLCVEPESLRRHGHGVLLPYHTKGGCPSPPSTNRTSGSGVSLSYSHTQWALTLRGHTGVRKAFFDAIRCGALPLVASAHTPLPFADEIDYSSFSFLTSEGARVASIVSQLKALPTARLAAMRAAMDTAAPLLDYRRGAIDAVLRRVARLAAGSDESAVFVQKQPTRSPQDAQDSRLRHKNASDSLVAHIGLIGLHSLKP
ncbi:hypothetical protein EMIHUDRAFT_219072 [Emiliania huxleyi CCMP1516]|uniref:Exostosin GT47 domain-containing protein n=2 Tax=Emiliania huxleyi TaxID=2903 RepID=A0A0D3I5N0_EMIH1|nr:hypothetical protein EMIHUDRAFT_219072 [Emiliania huxleyi CCMP1516]EOD06565.1 hypothetical protein EMIHUDRAFT_219072 [Emiliania huxleyi CCMP1516]|eukprot:XP_005758994.1 hypothetical protein EMIHUDRAFT_219072 [Emiliania huxleyi CCMP1516]